MDLGDLEAKTQVQMPKYGSLNNIYLVKKWAWLF